MATNRICIIGAGPSGMSALYQFAKMPVQPEIVCYEKQDTVGGLWNFSWRSGIDEYGEPASYGMYRNLWTNIPKEAVEYPDYTYDYHFGKVLPSFLPRAVVQDYLIGRFNSIEGVDLAKRIQFNTVVRVVTFDDNKDVFSVIINNLKTGEIKEEKFTHLIVASGVYQAPNIPDYPGFQSFPGEITHVHDIRDGRRFKDKALLIIGGSFSAEDIAMHAIKFGAKSVIVSLRSKPLNAGWPAGVEERPLIERMEGNTAYFKDGSSALVDEIVLCTGYRNHYPFLEKRLKIDQKTTPYPAGLYKGCMFLPAGNRRLFYIGAMIQTYTFTLFDCQSAWVCKYIMGTLEGEPKSDDEMKAESDKWRNLCEKIQDFCQFIYFQTDYVAMLVEETGLPKTVSEAAPILVDCLRQCELSMVDVKQKSYRSMYTGILSPVPKVPFMESEDESLESFLNSV